MALMGRASCELACRFKLPNSAGCFKSAHFRHLNIHQYRVEHFTLDGLNGFAAISGNNHRMSLLLQNCQGQLLIDHVIFSQQEAQRLSR